MFDNPADDFRPRNEVRIRPGGPWPARSIPLVHQSIKGHQNLRTQFKQPIFIEMVFDCPPGWITVQKQLNDQSAPRHVVTQRAAVARDENHRVLATVQRLGRTKHTPRDH